ncbi:hypothetical protein FGO68_gene12574 [Halteria grandinella]|uniref:Uncharacterized protein n=1 Tax=Halteria grandinella TaxID=5974 RepID=A0A8J8NPZ5_HALGN|nr:hypothetical protein FGO68_gene12574 [Halteria grandinella]
MCPFSNRTSTTNWHNNPQSIQQTSLHRAHHHSLASKIRRNHNLESTLGRDQLSLRHFSDTQMPMQEAATHETFAQIAGNQARDISCNRTKKLATQF